jgi:hypothetical protein
MKTLKDFLEYQVEFYRIFGNSYEEGNLMHWFHHGSARAFKDMLDCLPKDLLDNEIPDSTWRNFYVE